MPVGSHSIPSKNKQIEEAPLQNELMLFDPDSSKFFVLNSTMAYLWSTANGEKSLGEIAGAMSASFQGADPDVVQSDIYRAADELLAMGLLIDSSSEAP